MMWEYGMGYGGLGMLVFWLLPVLLILALIKYLSGRNSGKNDTVPNKALELLEERYARGEIDRAEYLQKRDDLKRG